MSMKKAVYGIIIICLGLWSLHLTDTDDYLVNELTPLLSEGKNKHIDIRLNTYSLDFSGTLACQNKNLSGITFNLETRTLFAITNSPPAVYEINRDGECLRKIVLNQFIDPEGIVYMEDNKFAVIEERAHKLSIIRIDETLTRVDPSQVIRSISIDLKEMDNKGFEGIAYDARDKEFYLVNEKQPMQVIRVAGLSGSDRPLSISLEKDLIPQKLYMDDFSGLHFEGRTRSLLFLSDESKLVSEVSLNGKIKSFMELEKNFAELKQSIPQAEGITMDDHGTLYIVSEPNLFYRFVKKRD